LNEVAPDDRIILDDIREDVRKVYTQLTKLNDPTLRELCAMLIVIHNHWNWEGLYQQLLKEGTNGTGS